MASSTKVKPVLAVVVWWDAWADGGDQTSIADAHEKHRATKMQTIGWILMDDTEGISIFNERCLDQGEEVYRSRTFIPRVLIVSTTPINLVSARKKRALPVPPAPPVDETAKPHLGPSQQFQGI